MITDNEYKEALKIVEQYKIEENERVRDNLLNFNLKFIQDNFPIGTIIANRSNNIIGEVNDYEITESGRYILRTIIRDENNNILRREHILPINATVLPYKYVGN